MHQGGLAGGGPGRSGLCRLASPASRTDCRENSRHRSTRRSRLDDRGPDAPVALDSDGGVVGIASTRDTILLASAVAPCGGGAGLGRDRLRADPMARWRALGESRCPGGRRRRGNRARFPLSVAVIAVNGTVLAVGGAVTGAVTAVTRGRDPCAGRDRLRSCAVAGRSPLSRRASGPGLHRSLRLSRSLTKRSLARPKLRSPWAARAVTSV
jgi:hypothetical protein